VAADCAGVGPCTLELMDAVTALWMAGTTSGWTDPPRLLLVESDGPVPPPLMS
jgi:hypothetical protein